MTSDQIYKATAELGWSIDDGQVLAMNPPTDVANLRASLEVAYQLAILNEQIEQVIGNRNPQIRVMVEPGEWPIQTQEQRR